MVKCRYRYGAVMTVEDIKRISADTVGVTVGDINGRGRSGKIPLARSIAIYLSRVKTGKTCEEIGKDFDRDHSLVSHSCKNISAWVETDPYVANLVNTVEAMLVMKYQVIQRVVIEKVYDVEAPTALEAETQAQKMHSNYLDKVESDPLVAQGLLYDHRDNWETLGRLS